MLSNSPKPEPIEDEVPTSEAKESRTNKRRSLAKTLKSGSMTLIRGIRRTASATSNSSCDSFVSSDDEQDDTELVSCMKGSRDESGNAKNRRRLRFRSNRSITKVYKIEPLFNYSKDLWWSKDEIESCKKAQSTFAKEDVETLAQAQAYLSAYVTARRQVFQNSDGQTDQQPSKPSMSGDVYNALVLGRSRGFGGLELYTPESKARRACVSEIVALTAAAYYDSVTLQNIDNADKMVRSYSRTLTEADRYWAVAMGSVDSAAAMDFYSPPSCIHSKYSTDENTSRVMQRSSMKQKNQAKFSHAA